MSALQAPPGFGKRASFEPQCTHLTMTRLYSTEALCSNCRLHGPLGWVYQCTQDREDMIEHAIHSGRFLPFDQLGSVLAPQVNLRKGSPAAREDRFSFFNEVTPDSMAKYKPEQIATILRQREHVQLTIQREQLRKSSASLLNRMAEATGPQKGPFLRHAKPWVRSVREECQYVICPRCRAGSVDRAFLSLDAVVNGEFLPTAASGYGFHVLGERPVVNAEILKEIGTRAVPFPSRQSQYADSSESEMSYTESSSDFDNSDTENPPQDTDSDRTILARIPEADDDRDSMNSVASVTSSENQDTPSRLKRSPRVENLGAFTDMADLPHEDSIQRLLWAAPMPVSQSNQNELCSKTANLSLSQDATVTDSLPDLGHIIGSRAPLSNAMPQGLNLKSKYRPLPEISTMPPITLATHANIKVNRDEASMSSDPMKVAHGVAMMEESVESGVPDAITHV